MPNGNSWNMLDEEKKIKAELLDVLKAAQDYVDADEGAEARHLRKRIDAAIAKAEGRK